MHCMTAQVKLSVCKSCLDSAVSKVRRGHGLRPHSQLFKYCIGCYQSSHNWFQCVIKVYPLSCYRACWELLGLLYVAAFNKAVPIQYKRCTSANHYRILVLSSDFHYKYCCKKPWGCMCFWVGSSTVWDLEGQSFRTDGKTSDSLELCCF